MYSTSASTHRSISYHRQHQPCLYTQLFPFTSCIVWHTSVASYVYRQSTCSPSAHERTTTNYTKRAIRTHILISSHRQQPSSLHPLLTTYTPGIVPHIFVAFPHSASSFAACLRANHPAQRNKTRHLLRTSSSSPSASIKPVHTLTSSAPHILHRALHFWRSPHTHCVRTHATQASQIN